MSSNNVETTNVKSVVTYLEMTEKPTRPSVPLPPGKLAILRMEEPSVSFYRFLYNGVGRPWLWWERRVMDDATLAAAIGDPDIHVYVLYAEGVPAGYVELDRKTPGEVEIFYFGLRPKFIGRGLGWYLLNWAVDTAWTGATSRVLVDTCDLDHPKALQLYQQAGFRVYEQKNRSDPVPTAIVAEAEAAQTAMAEFLGEKQ